MRLNISINGEVLSATLPLANKLLKEWVARDLPKTPNKVKKIEVVDLMGDLPRARTTEYFKAVRNLEPSMRPGGNVSGECSTDILRAAAFINGPKAPVRKGDVGYVLLLEGDAAPVINENKVRGDGSQLWPNDYMIENGDILGVITIRITQTS